MEHPTHLPPYELLPKLTHYYTLPNPESIIDPQSPTFHPPTNLQSPANAIVHATCCAAIDRAHAQILWT